MQTKKVHIVASGNSGNCTFMRLGETCVLVDAGIPVKRIRAALGALVECLESFSAVIVTYEHGDHVRGLARLLRALPELPVLATQILHVHH